MTAAGRMSAAAAARMSAAARVSAARVSAARMRAAAAFALREGNVRRQKERSSERESAGEKGLHQITSSKTQAHPLSASPDAGASAGPLLRGRLARQFEHRDAVRQ